MGKSRLTINLEYWALRTVCALVNAVPYRVAMAAASGLASLAVRALRFKRARTMARLRGVFPERSERERVAIAVASLRNVLQIGVELMRPECLTREWMERYVVEGERYTGILKAVVDEGRGAVVMLPHTGNWFVAANAMAAYGVRMVGLGSRQRNPKIDAWMKSRYGNLTYLDRDDRRSLIEIKKSVQAGMAFAIMPDLRVHDPDVEVGFLGGTANVSHAGAFFAVKCRAPIVVAAMRRENGRHVIAHLATIRSEGRAPEDLTREVMGLLDDFVRRHPGDWYWYNKRWILEPPDSH